MLPEQVWRFIDVLGGWLVGYPTQLNDNGFTSCLHNSTRRRLLAAAEGARVDTADLCYSKRNIWPCLFSEIDPTLCFEFIRKYVSRHPVCSCWTPTPLKCLWFSASLYTSKWNLNEITFQCNSFLWIYVTPTTDAVSSSYLCSTQQTQKYMVATRNSLAHK